MLVLNKWSGPDHTPSLVRNELLYELFEASVDNGPERIAVLCGGVSLTYRELDERANRLAHYLRRSGAAKKDCVAIFLPRSEHVYTAILGVLKAGCAYVPLDPETPADRIAFILEDCQAKCLITLSETALGLAHVLPATVSVIKLDSEGQEIADMPATRITRAETGLQRENLCYLIYTSGTTGRPKGVQIEHRNATNLIRAESRLYGVNRDDRVFQLASVAFDASVEEIWLAFFHGATLVVGTKEIMRSGYEFSSLLAKLGITVLSCVPTFLLMLEEDIPTVRILILGGEACPPDVAARWCRPGRVVFNTYGPTETTVIATASILEPGRPVTIGRPVANYKVYLLDEHLAPVPLGAEGEICIGGEGVARGYLNRPELQKEKFVLMDTLDGPPARLYRSADLGRFTPDGEIEYLGRTDDQVKLRGYRIELREIEAVLMQCPGVLAAAAALHKPAQQLAAYVVARAGQTPDRDLLRKTLYARLPPYMVPAFLDEIEALPLTSSNKIDRKHLPTPKRPLNEGADETVAPTNDAERTVMAAWEETFSRKGFSTTDDFFLDLGGHSMLAAITVSKLRRLPKFAGISLTDLYANPTIVKLAALAGKNAALQAPPSSFHETSPRVYLTCMAAQAIGVIFLAGLYAWQWLGPFLAYGYLALADKPVSHALLGAFIVYIFTMPAALLLSIALKWLLLGRMKPGDYPLWGWFYWRFWLVRAVIRATQAHYLDGTPLINIYYRLMGAKIGKDVFLGSHGLATFDLFSIGDGSSIGVDTSVDGAWAEGGKLHLGRISIGRGCFVGNRCTLGANTEMGDGSGLDDLSMLPDGSRIPEGDLWRGSPANPAGRLAPEPARSPWSPASGLAHLSGVVLFPLMVIAAIFPGAMLITHMGHMDEGYSFLIILPLVSFSFIFFLCLEVWVIKWLLLGRVKEGRYPVGGFFYVRKWFFDQFMAMSFEIMETLYETLYIKPWLRALGARIGPRSEMAAVGFLEPDLFEAGPECMVADLALIGAPRVRNGWFEIGKVRLDNRVFVGNSSVMPGGTTLADNSLLGALSIPPRPEVAEGTSWLGSPAINLPVRYKSDRFSEAETYHPPKQLVALRLFIEFFRVILPATLFAMLGSLVLNATDILQDYIGLREWMLLLPLLYILSGLIALGATLLLKKILIGRYRTGEKPLWCAYVWRSDLVTGVYDNLCGFFFLDMLRGTPFIAMALRRFGLKIGKRCYIDTTWFTEFDLLEIGDEVSLNENANLQTHLFEDRVIKMGYVRLGNRSVVGSQSTVLYDTELGAGAQLGDLSLVMKGESLPAGTRWYGLPAQLERGSSSGAQAQRSINAS